nr:hypothetical protein [Coxiella-like endosymbiont]
MDGENDASSLRIQYGNISTSSIGSLQRSLLGLSEAWGPSIFLQNQNHS